MDSIEIITRFKIKKNIQIKTSASLIIILFLLYSFTSVKANAITPLITSFQSDKTLADVNEDVIFTFTSDDVLHATVSYYQINFHDGTLPEKIPATKTEITHKFEYEGKYIVSLTAVAFSGITDLATLEIEICNQAPEIDIIIIPEQAYEDELINITVSDVNDSIVDKDELYFIWDLGDGSNNYGKKISYFWEEAGTYPITLTILDDQGAIDQAKTSIEILNVIPKADFKIQPIIPDCPYVISISTGGAYIYENCPLYFNATLSYDSPSDHNRTRYYWDFGDGILGNGIETYHEFVHSGVYDVNLKVVDDNGDFGSISKTINVINEPPEIELLTKDVVINEGDTFTFVVDSKDSFPDYPLLEYNWSFGKDGWKASNLFSDDFNDTVSVSVNDPEGESSSDQTKLIVKNLPPNINLYSAYVDMNLTLELRGPEFKNVTFLFEVIQDNETIGYFEFTKEEDECYVITPQIPFKLDLSKDYLFVINRTHELPCGLYRMYLTLSFLDGNSIQLCKLFKENWFGWKICPNEWIIDPESYLFDMPITFGGSIFDPGSDDIYLKMDHKIDIFFQIETILADYMCFPKSYHKEFCDGSILDLYAYKINRTIFVDINITKNLFDGSIFNPDGFPTEIPITPTIYPIDLSFLNLLECIDICGLFDIEINKALNIIEVKATDDDGASDFNFINIDTSKGEVDIENLAPNINILTYDNGTEDAIIPMFVEIYDFDGDDISVTWSFGDLTPSVQDPLNDSYILHSYEDEGYYMITATATDGKMTTIKRRIIRIDNTIPETWVAPFKNVTEDALINFANAYQYDDSVSDEDSLRFYWDFGDSTSYYQLNTSHWYSLSGMYPITLYAIDDNGDIGSYTSLVNVSNFAPAIEGPFGFDGIESSINVFDIAVFDSIDDEQTLAYEWKFEDFTMYGKRPTVYFNDGIYNATVMITDKEGDKSVVNISIIIEDVTPIVSATNKVIYGKPGDIQLTAYAMDTLVDENLLEYHWNINNETYFNSFGGTSSSIIYSYHETTTKIGTVEVHDDAGKVSQFLFQLSIIMDSDGDDLPDEYEAQIGASPNNADTDQDFILDWYELNVYGSDPNNPDTDGDGLPDGYGSVTSGFIGELILKTDILSNDTDLDGLEDGFEYFGWIMNIEIYNETIQGYQNVTYWTNSNPLLIDTDGDKVTDWEEYIYGRDPRKTDTDGDGVSDLVDLFPERADGDEDGLNDLKEIEMGTDPNNPDTDEDGLMDGEEYYFGGDGFITNPLSNDTDNDGLLDSQESYPVVERLKERHKISSGVNNFYLEVDSVGRIASANVKFSISLGEDTSLQEKERTVDLTISVYMRGRLILSEFFDDQTYLSNITDVMEQIENYGGNAGGQWRLKVESSRDCLLEEFNVEITKYLNPNVGDTDGDGLLDGEELNPELNPSKTKGWITDPTTRDTDGDTINDNIEIMRGWNPLSIDTDGDGVEDYRDANPKFNLIIKVTVRKGHFDSAMQILTPLLQVTLEVEADPIHKYEVASQSRWASEGSKDIKAWVPWICTTCWEVCAPWWLGGGCATICVPYPCLKEVTLYTIQTTGVFDNEYYFDVDDGDRDLNIKAQLWKNYVLGWFPQVSGSLHHNFMKSGYVMNNQYNKKIYQGSNWLSLDIETTGVSRVNTIAVYDDDVFSEEFGHYYQNERMSVVILDVSSSSRIFDKGINVIVIPTSVFSGTKLHSLIETTVGDDGQVDPDKWGNDFPSYLKGAKVSGIDRNDLKSEISPYIECIITRNATSSEARNILENLILMSANESEGLIYQYTREFRAEDLGLPLDILELIPLDMKDYENDPIGVWPRTPWENFIQLVVTIVQFIIDVLIAIGTFFIELFKWIVEAGLNLVETISQAAMAIIEAVIKAIILIFIFIMLAIFLLASLVLIAFFIGVGTILSLLAGELPEIGLLYVEFPLLGLPFRYEINIEWKYSEFLDLDVPVATSTCTINDRVFFKISEPIASALVSTESEIVPELSKSPDFQPDSSPYETETFILSETSNLEASSSLNTETFELPKSSQSPNAPILSANSVTPTEGWTTSTYTYYITYTSPTNSSPQYGPYLHVLGPNNYPFELMEPLNPSDDNYIDGAVFFKEMNLTASGEYHYYFEAKDNVSRSDTTELFNGPDAHDWSRFAQGFGNGVVVTIILNLALLFLRIDIIWVRLLVLGGTWASAFILINVFKNVLSGILAEPFPEQYQWGFGWALILAAGFLVLFSMLKPATVALVTGLALQFIPALIDFILGVFVDVSEETISPDFISGLTKTIIGLGFVAIALSAFATAGVLLGSRKAFGAGIPDTRNWGYIGIGGLVLIYVIFGIITLIFDPGFPFPKGLF